MAKNTTKATATGIPRAVALRQNNNLSVGFGFEESDNAVTVTVYIETSAGLAMSEPININKPVSGKGD